MEKEFVFPSTVETIIIKSRDRDNIIQEESRKFFALVKLQQYLIRL